MPTRIVVIALAALLAVTAFGADKVHKVGEDGVTRPEPIERVEPQYTDQTKQEGIEGTVVLSVVITADGRVDQAKVTKPLHPDLDRNAIEAAAKWKFKPAEKDGKPVAVRATIEINFRLK